MRISDWSSDVCSFDLSGARRSPAPAGCRRGSCASRSRTRGCAAWGASRSSELHLASLGRDDAGVEAAPGELGMQAAELDLRAAVHHHREPRRAGALGSLVVDDAELHPPHLDAPGPAWVL